ncbi:MAG: tRNA pseudouridine55 synthase [Blastocatellia bacterium]|jgi:tRNA pseudouridine55 synthase|nr:tRNA pseudouridine55 synthase [Blastocatellia bacterium]
MDGVLIIDKPAGPTSHDAVARVRRALKEKRVGHTGTLDPFATGVLVILVGRATRLAQFLSGATKEYEALIRFGYSTDTGDSTGKPKSDVQSPKSKVQGREEEVQGPKSKVQSQEGEGLSLEAEGLSVKPDGVELDGLSPKHWTDDEIEAALASLRGERLQEPPMYSAKKVQGQKLYEMARRGVEIERRPVPVTIHELEAVRAGAGEPSLHHELLLHNEDGTCDLSIRVACSAGTYIRVLAEEVGTRLGTGAHLAALRRTRAGQFHINQSVPLDELPERDATNLLLPPDAALSFMPFVHLTGEEARRATQGNTLRSERAGFKDGERVRLRDEQGSLLAVAVYDAQTGSLRPRVVIAS